MDSSATDPQGDTAGVVGTGATLRRHAWRRMRPAGSVERMHDVAIGWDAGTAIVDRAVDAGAGALLIIDGTPPSDAARAIAALYLHTDATAVVSDPGSDLQWMEQCTSVRDRMVEMRPLVSDAAALLSRDPRLAGMVAAMVQAAARRTPVVVAGALPQLAALAAQRVASPSTGWISIAIDSADTAARAARGRLGLTPWASLDWQPDDDTIEVIVRALLADLDGTAQEAGR